ncbi:hypothetical protein D3C85_1790120 [compost metagenome]
MLFCNVFTLIVIPAARLGERATDSVRSNSRLVSGADTVLPAGIRVFKSPANKPIAVEGEAGKRLIPV